MKRRQCKKDSQPRMTAKDVKYTNTWHAMEKREVFTYGFASLRIVTGTNVINIRKAVYLKMPEDLKFDYVAYYVKQIYECR